MGLKDKLKNKKSSVGSAERNALDLCTSSINSVFNECIATPTTLPSDMETVYLFLPIFSKDITKELIAASTEYSSDKKKELISNLMDFEDTTTPINFDKTKLAENRKKIQFMFGQLSVVHRARANDGPLQLTADNSHIKYDGSTWNREDVSLMQLYYLAIAADLSLGFWPPSKAAGIGIDTLFPTLSPNDPNFPAWWAEHKAEWEGTDLNRAEWWLEEND